MKLLQRHIFWSVLFTCAMASGLFVFILLVGNVLKELLGYLLTGQMPMEVFVKSVLLLLPYAMGNGLPPGILAGVLLVFGRMSAQSEVTAMRASGLGIGFMAAPVLLLGVLGVAVELGVNGYYMPMTRPVYKQMLQDAVRQDPLRMIVPRTFVREFPGVVIYVNKKEGGLLKDCWVWHLDKEKRVKAVLHAREGEVGYDEAANKLMVTLREVTTEVRNEKSPEDFSEPQPMSTLGEVPVDLELGGIFGKQSVRQRAHWMTLDQLVGAMRRLAAEGKKLSREWMVLSMALHEKLTQSMMVLAFVLFAIPLGIRVSRKESSANLGVAAVLVLIYYAMTVSLGMLDKFPRLRPDLLMWITPVAFLVFGGCLFRRVGKN